jgi:hypothetical protein
MEMTRLGRFSHEKGIVRMAWPLYRTNLYEKEDGRTVEAGWTELTSLYL